MTLSKNWVVTGFCALGYGLSYSLIMSMNVYTDHFVDVFHVSYKDASLIPCISFAFMCATPLATVILQRFGFRWPVIVSACLASAVDFACFYVQSFSLLVLLLGAVVGFCFCIIATASLIAPGCIFCEEKRHIAVAIVCAGNGVGLIIFPVFMEYLIESFGFRGSFWVVSAVVLNLTAVGAIMPIDLPPDKRQRLDKRASWTHGAHFEVFKMPVFWALALSSILIGNAITVMNSFNLSILENKYDLEPSTGTMIMAGGGAMSILGRLSVSFVRKSCRFPRWWIWSLSNMTMGFGLVIFGLLTVFPSAVFSQCVYGFCTGQSVTIHVVVVMDLFSQDQFPIALSYMYLIGVIGIAWAPMAGWLRDMTQSFTAPLLLAGGLQLAAHSIPVCYYACVMILEGWGITGPNQKYKCGEKNPSFSDQEKLPMEKEQTIKIID